MRLYQANRNVSATTSGQPLVGGAHPYASQPNLAWAEQRRHRISRFLVANEAALSALPRELHER